MNEVVNNESVTETPVAEATVVENTTPEVKAGDKTPPNLLLKSLQEEREERRKLEERLSLLESSNSSDVFSDEGKALKGELNALKTQIESLNNESAKKDVLASNPVLKDKWEEFENFRSDPENKGMNLKTAAKAFLVENGMFEVKRDGLEKTTGGQRTAPVSGQTAEDIKILREQNPKKYQSMLVKGELKI